MKFPDFFVTNEYVPKVKYLCYDFSHYTALYAIYFDKAAFTNPTKSGCGLSGLDLNSGWN